MVVIEIQTLGEERLIRGFNRFLEDVKDIRPALYEIQKDFYAMNERNFSAQGKPVPFPPLSPRYAEWKSKHFPGKPIMRATDKLFNSLTGVNQEDAQDTIADVKKMSARFGTRVGYALRHQLGYDMPMRKIVQLEEESKRRWTHIIHRYAQKSARVNLFFCIKRL